LKKKQSAPDRPKNQPHSIKETFAVNAQSLFSCYNTAYLENPQIKFFAKIIPIAIIITVTEEK
jgi:hypothetical protein